MTGFSFANSLDSGEKEARRSACELLGRRAKTSHPERERERELESVREGERERERQRERESEGEKKRLGRIQNKNCKP